MLFISDIPVHCINQVAIEYHVPAKLILAVLEVSQGKVGQAKPNSNGTYDLGPMQINTSWWPGLYRYGITPQAVQYNPCINVNVGAWILAGDIANGSNLLSGIGDYHSHTLPLNYAYTQKVSSAYITLSKILRN